MKLETVKEYLKNKINNSWYINAKEDYGIEGQFKNCELIDENTLNVIWEEQGEEKTLIINYYWDYTLEQLYNIWMEFGE